MIRRDPPLYGSEKSQTVFRKKVTLEAVESRAWLRLRRDGDGVERKGRFRIQVPLIAMTKEQFIERGNAFGLTSV